MVLCCSCFAPYGLVPDNKISWAYVILNWLIVSTSVVVFFAGVGSSGGTAFEYALVGLAGVGVGLIGVFAYWQLGIAKRAMCFYNWLSIIIGLPIFAIGAAATGVGGFAAAFGSMNLIQIGGLALLLGFLILGTSISGIILSYMKYLGCKRAEPVKDASTLLPEGADSSAPVPASDAKTDSSTPAKKKSFRFGKFKIGKKHNHDSAGAEHHEQDEERGFSSTPRHVPPTIIEVDESPPPSALRKELVTVSAPSTPPESPAKTRLAPNTTRSVFIKQNTPSAVYSFQG